MIKYFRIFKTDGFHKWDLYYRETEQEAKALADELNSHWIISDADCPWFVSNYTYEEVSINTKSEVSFSIPTHVTYEFEGDSIVSFQPMFSTTVETMDNVVTVLYNKDRKTCEDEARKAWEAKKNGKA